MNGNVWQPSCSLEMLSFRALWIKEIRSFFDAEGYLEVETPIMAKFGISDVYLANIKAQFRQKEYSLQTSPEYHMKRLLAYGSGSIYQISKVFRDDELGRWHNPEFSLLELYKLDANHHDLIQEMSRFLEGFLECAPIIKKTYQEAFLESCNIDPSVFNKNQWLNFLESHNLSNVLTEDDKEDKTQYLFLMMSHVVEPYLAKTYDAPVAVYDFPKEQAALSKIIDGKAARFEVYYKGIELANGFFELTDVAEQKQRFQQDNEIRQNKFLPEANIDVYFLEALNHGLPECTGVALGVDRLLALKANANNLSEVLSFAFDRA